VDNNIRYNLSSNVYLSVQIIISYQGKSKKKELSSTGLYCLLTSSTTQNVSSIKEATSSGVSLSNNMEGSTNPLVRKGNI